jgi:small subunit ribosomal protein S4
MMGPKEKRERALGMSLGLKGERSGSPKSALTRKPYKPGVHGPNGRPRALSEFGLQLREKSKFKLTYGVDENNLKRLYGIAAKAKGSTGLKLLELLERRLDNVVYRLGFTPNRLSARQLVLHGHVTVNGKKVTSPGLTVEKGDIVGIKESSAGNVNIVARREAMLGLDVPTWLALTPNKMEGTVLGAPSDLNPPFEINLLVESFSK